MDTAAAAQQAGVTVATIRTWCRRNAIAAVKKAGRWIINAASLTYRISLSRKPTVTDIQAPATGAVLVYYGDLSTPTQLRKVEIRRTRAFIAARMGLTDPNTSTGSAARPAGTPADNRGALIPDTEEDTLIQEVRELGGRATQTGGRIKHDGDTATINKILALAARLWGQPTATATEYGQQPIPVTDLPVTEAFRRAQ